MIQTFPWVAWIDPTNKLVGGVREPIACKPGQITRVDNEIHYTLKHGSWLNMAEIELSAHKGQCLSSRIPDKAIMQAEAAAWEKNTNNRF